MMAQPCRTDGSISPRLFKSFVTAGKMYRKRFYGKVFKWVGKAAHGLRFISLRYFNAAGAHVSGKIGEAHNPESHLIPLIL